MRENAFRTLRVSLPAANPAATGRANRDRREKLAGTAETQAGQLTDDLVETVSELLMNPELAARMGRAGRSVLEENRGALERLLVLLEPLLATSVRPARQAPEREPGD